MGSIRTIADGNRTYIILENFGTEETNRFIRRLYSDEETNQTISAPESSKRLIPAKAEVPEIPKKIKEEPRPDYNVVPKSFADFCDMVMFFIKNVQNSPADKEYYEGLKKSINGMIARYRETETGRLDEQTVKTVLTQALNSFSKQDLPVIYKEMGADSISSVLENTEQRKWLWQYVFRQRKCLM